jgi:hypothetical protein
VAKDVSLGICAVRAFGRRWDVLTLLAVHFRGHMPDAPSPSSQLLMARRDKLGKHSLQGHHAGVNVRSRFGLLVFHQANRQPVSRQVQQYFKALTAVAECVPRNDQEIVSARQQELD